LSKFRPVLPQFLVAASLGLALTMSTMTSAADAADLPAAIKARGTIIAAIVPNYPPLDVRDPATNQLTGLDVDLGDAIAKRLGVTMQWQETNFEQMMSALATGRVDIIMSGMSDLASRHDGASFVDYMSTGPAFLTRADRIADFPDMLALCGKAVGASRRTNFPKDIAAWNDANCVPAGKESIRYVGTEGSADARTQLKQGRIDASVQGNETIPYIMAQEPNTFAPIGKPIATQLTGIGFAKADNALRDAVAGALSQLIADGTYKQLLTKWSLADNALEKVTIDAGE